MWVAPDADVDAEIEKWRELHPGAYAAQRDITEKDLPPTDEFRDAWTLSEKGITYRIATAREIAKDLIRLERDFAALDIAYTRADEAGDTVAKKAIAAKKQVLRDATADERLTKADSIDALKTALDAIRDEIKKG